jgi:hypothetical protein
MRKLPKADFWLKTVRAENGCLLWTGPRSGTFSTGYGTWGKQHYAHHESYTRTYGEIPKGMVVCHKCDTPLCVEPSHLFLGTRKDNQVDMAKKGRWKNQFGAGPNHKNP